MAERETEGQQTLDVVVESEIAVAVFFQQAKCVVIGKVLKLHQRPLTVSTGDSTKELVNQFVITLTTNTLVSETDVRRVVHQFLCIH